MKFENYAQEMNYYANCKEYSLNNPYFIEQSKCALDHIKLCAMIGKTKTQVKNIHPVVAKHLEDEGFVVHKDACSECTYNVSWDKVKSSNKTEEYGCDPNDFNYGLQKF